MKIMINCTIIAVLLSSFFCIIGCDDVLKSVTTNDDSLKKELKGTWNIKEVTTKSNQNTISVTGIMYFEDCNTVSTGDCAGYYQYGNNKYDFSYTCKYFDESNKRISVSADVGNPLSFGPGTYSLTKTVGKLKIDTGSKIIGLER
jgi:hypothetical protein